MGCNSSQDLKKVEEAVTNGKKESANTENHVSNSPEKIHDISEDIKTLKSKATTIAEEFGEQEQRAATKIQAAFRGHQVRKKFIPVDEAAIDEEINAKPILGAKKSIELVDSRVEKAKEAVEEKVKMSADKTIDPTKAELEAEFDPDDKDLCNAATKIQASFRGHQVRKQKEEKEDDKAQEPMKELDDELADIDLADPELNKAATKIQATFRGHKVRKDV